MQLRYYNNVYNLSSNFILLITAKATGKVTKSRFLQTKVTVLFKTLLWFPNINWRDVQIKNVVNNVDMSSLRAPWQNGPYKN